MTHPLADLLRSREFMKRADLAWSITQESTHETSFFADKIEGYNSWIYTGVWLGQSSRTALPLPELIDLANRLRKTQINEELREWKKELRRTGMQDWYFSFRTDRKVSPPIEKKREPLYFKEAIIKDYAQLHTHPEDEKSFCAFPSLSDLNYMNVLDMRRNTSARTIGLLLTRASPENKYLTLVIYQNNRKVNLPTAEEYEKSQAFQTKNLDPDFFQSLGFQISAVNYPLREEDTPHLEKFTLE